MRRPSRFLRSLSGARGGGLDPSSGAPAGRPASNSDRDREKAGDGGAWMGVRKDAASRPKSRFRSMLFRLRRNGPVLHEARRCSLARCR